jgi:chemotaxis protein methyltransferase CheR
VVEVHIVFWLFSGYTVVITQQFREIIKNYTGLHIREQDIGLLQSKIQVRMKALKLASPEEYYHYLASDFSSEKATLMSLSQEWQHFIQLLTVGESYFFRDRGQFQLLQQQILPQLIQARSHYAAIHRTKPSLRIWSAGCSTGEEAYSLAILVHQLIPDLANWNLLILGTDLNADAIAKARRGVYNSWSFRAMNGDLQSKYFHPDREGWKLDEQIRRMVTFRPGNLVKDSFPDSRLALSDIDLIICRNVFIYFTPEIIASVLVKLSNTLSFNGYLITGHAELHNQNLGQLHTQIFSESVVYQRCDREHFDQALTAYSNSAADHYEELATLQTRAQSTILEATHSIPIQPIESQTKSQTESPHEVKNTLQEAESYFSKGEYAKAIQVAQQALVQKSRSFDLYYLIAQAYASLDEYDRAKYYCEKAIEIDALSTAPYYLLAHIAREQGHLEQTKNLLKRVIYLDSTAITAYLELSSLYTQENDAARAKKMKENALDLMQKLSSESSIKF